MKERGMATETKSIHKTEGKPAFRDIRVGLYPKKAVKTAALASLFFEEERVTYRLLLEEGSSRAVYGTACSFFYTLVIEDRDGTVSLPDIARDEAAARRWFFLFAEAGVPSGTAYEVAEELLARDFPHERL